MKREYVILGVIILASLLLRLPHLTDKEKGTDEKLTINSAHTFTNISSFKNIFESMPHEVNPPLFFIILSGFLLLYDSIVLIKVVVVIIGVLSLIPFYLLIRDMFNKNKALIFTFVYAINPMHVILSQHLRSYVLIFFLFNLSLYFLYKFLINKKQTYFVYLLITYLVSMYVHYYSVLFTMAGGLTILYRHYIHKIKINKRMILLSILAFLLIIPSLLLLKAQINVLYSDKTKFVITPEIIPYPLYKMSLMVDVSTALESFPYLMIAFPLLLLLAAYGFYRLYKYSKFKTYFLTINFLTPYVVLSIAGLIWAIHSFRYITFLLPLYITFFMYGLVNIRNNVFRNLIAITVFICWLVVLVYYFNIVTIYHWNTFIAV